MSSDLPNTQSGASETSTDNEQALVVRKAQAEQTLRARPRPVPVNSVALSTTADALTYTRLALLASISGANLGFGIAKKSTQFGFHVARTLLKPVLRGAGILENASMGTGRIEDRGAVEELVHSCFNGIEMLALFGIHIGEKATQLSLTAANSTVAYLEGIFGNGEALKSLSAFLMLVEREYNTSLPGDPTTNGLGDFSLVEVAKAAATWAALQNVTRHLDGQRFLPELQEIDVKSWRQQRRSEEEQTRSPEVIFEVTAEELGEAGEEIVSASVHERSGRFSGHNSSTTDSSSSAHGDASGQGQLGEDETRDLLRRFTRLGLAVYGGLGVIFLGIELPDANGQPIGLPKGSERLTHAALARLQQEELATAFTTAFQTPASVSFRESFSGTPSSSDNPNDMTLDANQLNDRMATVQREQEEEQYTESSGDEDAATTGTMPGSFGLWDMLTGVKDSEILERIAQLRSKSAYEAYPVDGQEEEPVKPGRKPPRFFVVTDHSTKSVCLCLRGSTTIDDFATDLACESAEFDETKYWDDEELQYEDESVTTRSQDGGWVEIDSEADDETYTVHGGMWEVAQALGHSRSALTRTLKAALDDNPDYTLFLTGHSLGAGIAALLGLMYANPTSCTTTRRSGLPPGRSIRVFGIATPCTTDAKLSRRLRKLCHSFCLSSDMVCRFSLGHVRDCKSASTWLCWANRESPEEGCNAILSRILAYKRGALDHDLDLKMDEEAWFMSMRRTLEANMHHTTLYPPGDIFWLALPEDMQMRAPTVNSPTPVEEQVPRLFRVTGRPEVIFRQILFTKKMISIHMPHQYLNAVKNYL